MKNTEQNYIRKYKARHKRLRRYAAIFTVLALLIVVAVNWRLHQTGISMTADYQCGQEEHVHTDACYTKVLTCGQDGVEGHTHTDECYTKELTCGKTEHTHTAACYSDESADLETAETWEATLPQTLGADAGSNVALIAKSQIGYSESSRNFKISDDGTTQKGYSRYGAWYGNAYGDWSSMFAAFCLHYAGVSTDEVPVNSGIDAWKTDLQNAGLYEDESYTPSEGDMAFFDTDGNGEVDHVGVIASVDEINATLDVIVGDLDGTVAEKNYSANEAKGYLNLPGKTSNDAEAIQTASEILDDEDLNGQTDETNVPSTVDDTIDKGVTINVSTTTAEGKNGVSLQATINSTNSHPNETMGDEELRVDIGTLPTGVTLAGFKDGQMSVHYGNEETGGYITVTLHTNADGTSYVTYTQPAGSTVQVVLQFNSENGIMDALNEIKLTPSITNAQSNDIVQVNGIDVTQEGAAQYLTLKWTGENLWDNVSKTVNKSSLEINSATNTLEGDLSYTIKATEKNADGKDDTGAIWTEKVVLSDTLTLPDGISFPEGSYASDGVIYSKSGDKLFEFNFGTSSNNNYTVEAKLTDSKTISYTITAANTKKSGTTYTGEMDSINISANFYTSKLTLEEDLYKDTTLSTKKIENTVNMETYPVAEYTHYKSSATVTTTPAATEKSSITKTASVDTVDPESTITYTVTVSNTGAVPLNAKDSNGNTRYITDTLSKKLTLTTAQISAIEGKGGTVTGPDSNGQYTISFEAGEIAVGETKTVSFDVTVKSLEDMAAVDGTNTIENTAKYNNQDGYIAVKYIKNEISKKASASNVSVGDEVIYTLTIKNPGTTDSKDETVTDTLPTGLEFVELVDQSGTTLSGNTYQADSTTNASGHEATFTQNGQTLTWSLGSIGAGESVTLYYKCKVTADGESKSLTNTAVLKSGDKATATITVPSVTEVDKKVKAEDDTDWSDGNGSYKNGTTLTYKISISNAEGDTASTKTDHTLTDTLQAGLIPVSKDATLYNLSSGSWNASTSEANLSEAGLTMGDFLSKSNYNWGPYYVVINGDVVKVSKSNENANNDYYAAVLSWYIGSLSAGETVEKTYPVVLTMTESELAEGSKSYVNTVTDGSKKKSVTVNGKSDTASAASADIQKDVYAITLDPKSYVTSSGWYENTKLDNKTYFSTTENKDIYVIYNITVVNTGTGSVNVKKVVDDYGEDLTYVGMLSGTSNYQYIMNFVNQGSSITTTDYNTWNSYGTGTIKTTVTLTNNDTTDHRAEYSIGGDEGVTLAKGAAFTFSVMCRLDKDTATEKINQKITNKAELYVDSDVEYSSYGTITTSGTPNDAYQNNGETKDEGLTEDGTQRVISSSVSVTPTNSIIPGIKKEAVGYVPANKTIDGLKDITSENKKNNIMPNSVVKWQVTLLNDGTVPIDAYDIVDDVESPFHILTEEEATSDLGITDDNRLTNKVFALEIYDSPSATKPSKTVDLSSRVWASVGSSEKQSVTVSISKSDDLAIPAGGYAVFTVYTKNTVQKFTIYENTASFYPKTGDATAFDSAKVETGQVVEDENGNLGVKASDSVYAMGDYGSFSWKQIAEESDTSNNAVGYDTSNNYITIEKEDTNKLVIFTDNIENVSSKAYEELVLVNLMPYPGDTGVLNQSQKRGSEFTISYADNFSLMVTDKDGNTRTLTLGTDYTLEFSTKTGFTEGDMDNTSSDGWHSEWQTGDTSFRLVLSSSFTLEPEEILSVSYTGLIGDDADPGEIAWNSFGYAYGVTGAGRLSAEPPKVGVKIRQSSSIRKEVIDTEGNDLGTAEDTVFTFKIYEGETVSDDTYKGSFTLGQGTSKKIDSITDENGTALFENGKTYTLVEENHAGYKFNKVNYSDSSSDTSEDTTENKFTFTYNEASDEVIITITNKAEAYELPKSGGSGTFVYLAAGAALMCISILLYGYRIRKIRERRRRG